MREKNKEGEKKGVRPIVEKNFSEILVGSGRSQEPYIIAFHYSGNNVAASPLGTLFGFFEIEVHDEDSAYIVNFLASVAKKEYFTNTRRSPVESFESTLHKVNVALSELAKHGNISWLGRLHGALGVTSKNTLHFSVTGEGSIFLARNGEFRSISEGLAEKMEEPHPLKTFTEVASGELYPEDLFLTLSPGVWTLFTPAALKKSLERLGKKGFEQFLRTALVSELGSAAVVLVECQNPEEKLPKEKKEENSEAKSARLANVFSGTTFLEEEAPALSRNTASPQDEDGEDKREYIDEKTGHIYVHGDVPDGKEENPWKEKSGVFLESLSFSLERSGTVLRRISRRTRKYLVVYSSFLGQEGARLGRGGVRRLRSFKRHLRERRAASFIEREVGFTRETYEREKDTVVFQKEEFETRDEERSPSPSLARFIERERIRSLSEKKKFWNTLPSLASLQEKVSKEMFSRVLQTSLQASLSFLSLLKNLLLGALQRLSFFWQRRNEREKLWIGIGILILLLILGAGSFFYFSRDPEEGADANEATVVPAPTPLAEEASFPPGNEPKASLLSPPASLYAKKSDESLLAVLFLGNEAYGITSRRIIHLASRESIDAPTSLLKGTAMNDLRTLFLLGENGVLYAYTPDDKKFIESTFPIPEGSTVDELGSYLTYLYVLDKKDGKIHRFPRAEGGFASPTSWLKEELPSEETSAFTVGDTLLLGSKGGVFSYSQGKKTALSFQGPASPAHPAALFSSPEADIFALDKEARRIVHWKDDGVLEAQYFAEHLSQAKALAVSPDKKRLLVALEESIQEYSLP